MGFLSSAAEKAFTKGRRRAYVPDWFQPLSYLVGGIAAAVLVVGVVTYDGDDPQPATQSTPPTITTPTNSTDGTATTAPSPAVTSPDDSAAPVGADGTVTLAGPDGTTVAAPADAVAASQLAVRALFTGDFAGVTIYPGQPTPSVVRTWPNPRIEATSTGEQLVDGTWRFSAIVDPDDAGPELPRQVTVFIAPVEQSWAYLPG